MTNENITCETSWVCTYVGMLQLFPKVHQFLCAAAIPGGTVSSLPICNEGNSNRVYQMTTLRLLPSSPTPSSQAFIHSTTIFKPLPRVRHRLDTEHNSETGVLSCTFIDVSVLSTFTQGPQDTISFQHSYKGKAQVAKQDHI